ncbi:hypothetical protein K4L44_15875 [Halosquirtibacter laminarini]|uniref:Uncharacterized protein n=1 Tax=Halosquirtibacter laminarini TaxID=3374600 RepID=A0AC61NEP0_9BACT|nr:hypothetical protein K4L44_15875 [Prolixibacteraceae bacterium]
MRTIEKILEFCVILGFILRMMLVNNGYLIEGVSLLLIGIFYFIWSIFRFKDYSFRRKDQSTCIYDPISKRMSLLAGFGLFLTCSGAGQHMVFITSSNALVFLGMTILLIVAISETIVFIKEKRVHISRVYKRVFVWLAIGIGVWYMSGERAIQVIYRKHPRFIKAYKAVKKYPDNEKYREIMWNEYDKVMGKKTNRDSGGII